MMRTKIIWKQIHLVLLLMLMHTHGHEFQSLVVKTGKKRNETKTKNYRQQQ
jgi:hypothetical protein